MKQPRWPERKCKQPWRTLAEVQCTKCHVVKAVSDYYLSVTSRVCKACWNSKPRSKVKAGYDAARQAARRADPVRGPVIKAADRKRLEAWRASHPEKVKEMARHRRRKKDHLVRARRGTKQPSHLTANTVPTRKAWLSILGNFGNRCAYCDTPLAKPTGGKRQADNEETLDHFIPLALGGTHEASNVVPACRKCNVDKSAREPRTWIGDEDRYQFVCDMRSLVCV